MPSRSRIVWREHLYVEMVQFFHSSSLTDGVCGVPFGPTEVEPGLASGTDVVAAVKSGIDLNFTTWTLADILLG